MARRIIARFQAATGCRTRLRSSPAASPVGGHWAATINDPDLSNNIVARNGTISIGSGAKVPLSADFDGDRKADPGVYHEAAGSWEVKLSGSSYATAVLLGFGGTGYRSAAMDYDGDGKADPAVYNEIMGNWSVKLSASSYATAQAQQ